MSHPDAISSVARPRVIGPVFGLSTGRHNEKDAPSEYTLLVLLVAPPPREKRPLGTTSRRLKRPLSMRQCILHLIQFHFINMSTERLCFLRLLNH